MCGWFVAPACTNATGAIVGPSCWYRICCCEERNAACPVTPFPFDSSGLESSICWYLPKKLSDTELLLLSSCSSACNVCDVVGVKVSKFDSVKRKIHFHIILLR